jgi:hypothetical protein
MTRHRTLVLTGSLILGLGLAAPALAQSVDDRLSNQAERISEGIRDGSLTAGEAARLKREQAGIAREEQRFKSDGKFTPRERQKTVHDENRLSRQIYRQRHDGQRRR